jgi:hypothetical protein
VDGPVDTGPLRRSVLLLSVAYDRMEKRVAERRRLAVV